MPESRVERIIFGLGLLVIAGLVAVIVLEKRAGASKSSTPPTQAAQTAPVTTAPGPTPTAPATSTQEIVPTTAPTTTAAAAPPARPAASLLRLRLTAKQDTWLELRVGSATGRRLYFGILKKGSTESFRAARFWVRFGAATNLEARVNGKPLALPIGTYTALIRKNGIEKIRS